MNCLKKELWKAIHNRFFILSIAVGTIIILCDVIQNVDAVKQLSQDSIASGLIANGFDGFSLFVRWIALNGYTFGCKYFYLIWPILAAIPYGWSYSYEFRNGVMNQIITRVNKRTYFFSKFISVFVSGGLAVAIPITINLLVNALVCPYSIPVVTNYLTSVFDGWFLSNLFYTIPWIYGFIWCFVEFLIGGATASLCFLTGSKLKLQVTITLAPFIICFILDIISNFVLKITDWNLELSPLLLAMAGPSNANPEWLIFTLLALFTGISLIMGYWQVMKHELA